MGASPENPYQGGCLCGTVRFEIGAPAFHTHHCHCSMCRKCQGALFPTFAFVNHSDFTITQGADHLATCDSSPSLYRHFCPTCGSHIYADADSDLCHIFWDSRVAWYEPDDTFPRFNAYAV